MSLWIRLCNHTYIHTYTTASLHDHTLRLGGAFHAAACRATGAFVQTRGRCQATLAPAAGASKLQTCARRMLAHMCAAVIYSVHRDCVPWTPARPRAFKCARCRYTHRHAGVPQL